MKRAFRGIRSSVVGIVMAATVASVGAVVGVANAVAAGQFTTTGNVNMRSGPGTSYQILAVVPLGATVTASGSTSGSWTEVTYNGRTGYVSSSYLRATAAPAAAPATATASGTKTTTTSVNVRSGPGTSFAVVGTAAAGTAVPTTGNTSGGWTEVVWAGTNRWISSSYLTGGSSQPTQPAASTTATVGQVKTTANLYLRTDSYLGAGIEGTLPAQSIVDVTGRTSPAYTQILYQGRLLWIATAYTVAVTQAPVALVSTVDTRIQKVVDYAKAHLGDDYVWGGEGPNVFDCSGLTMLAYRQIGISLPHYSVSQSQLGKAVARADLKAGDLIFWYSPVRHVSLYVGNGQMVHAANPTRGVVTESVDGYAKYAFFAGARRFVS